jgi:ribosomal RNA-processing protein 1
MGSLLMGVFEQVWLTKKERLEELEVLKIWKGLFYCMWLSDKTPIQQELAGNIAKIVHAFDDLDRAKLFITIFYRYI